MALDFKDIENSANDKVSNKNKLLSEFRSQLENEVTQIITRPLRNNIMSLFTEENLKNRLEEMLINNEDSLQNKFFEISFFDNARLTVRSHSLDNRDASQPYIFCLGKADEAYSKIEIRGDIIKCGLDFTANAYFFKINLPDGISFHDEEFHNYFNLQGITKYTYYVGNFNHFLDEDFFSNIESILEDLGFDIIDSDYRDDYEYVIRVKNPYYKGD